ncbi:MAG TPA: DPP IV N-terminal domain-containing protein, partial [Pyrinomonadaceae bacterium]|nr:DPP IV N-terminal domain-containing protein [Pyrinomonadaceae bacterium]
EEIISKSLEKDRDERYQTIKDLLVDLRRLKKRLDFESEAERSLTPDGRHSTESPATPATLTHGGSSTASLHSIRPTSSAEFIVSEIKRHKTGVILAVIGVPLVVGAAFLLWSKFSSEKVAATPTMKIAKLTSGGRVNNILIDGSTSISPDGKYVVYTLIDGGRVSMWVRQILTGSDVQIVPPSDLRNGGTTISNDGEFVYYIGVNRENTGGSLFQVPILGGTPRKIMSQVRSPIGFSPDGSQFAFIRESTEQAQSLMIANSDGTAERTLAVRKGNDWFASEGPSWSPDGKWIACAAGTDTGGSYMTILGYSVADGSEKQITQQRWHGDIRRVIWLRDGSGIVAPVADSAQGSQLWFISQPDGTAKRITNDLNGYGAVSLGVSGDGKTIVTVQSNPSYHIWTMSLADASAQPVEITHGESDGLNGIDWTPDGELAYFARGGENVELFVARADGTQPRSLLKDNKLPTDPAVSPDGKTIYFTSNRSGTPHIWRINTDGTDLTQITSGDFADLSPAISPDGKWIVFVSWRSGMQLLWIIPTAGGEAEPITNVPSQTPRFSPDGKSVASIQLPTGANGAWQLAVINVENPSAGKLISPPPHFDLGESMAWTPDNQALIVKSDQGGVGNLWLQPISGGAPKQITRFTSDLISRFALSRDGKHLALSRGNSSLDVVLIKDFR